MNMINKFLFGLFAIIVGTTTIFATEVVLELDNTKSVTLPGEKESQLTVFAGETFELKATIKNADTDTGDLKISGLDKLQVIGNSSSSSFALINNKMSAEKTRIFTVRAENEGAYEIGPAEVSQNGSIIKSNVIKFRIINRPGGYKEKTNESEKNNENLIECSLTADKKNVFVGEPLTVTLKIKCFGQIHNLQMDTITFPGFQTKDDQKAEQRIESKDNKTYQVIEKKFYLMALTPGEQKINPAKLAYHIPQRQKQRPLGMLDDGFFAGFGGLFERMQLVQKNAYSNGLNIKILTMPQNQEQTDGVGRFTSFKCTADKTTALLNEAIKLTLEIEGEGNFEQIATPKLKLDPFIKNYESKTEFIEDPSHKPFTGKKIFEYIIQVGKTGDIVIPAQKFTYLDTAIKSVKTLESSPITLQIAQPEGETTTQKTPQQSAPIYQVPEEEIQQPETKNSSEISFIEQDGQVLQKNNWTMPWWLMLILFIIPMLLYIPTSKKLLMLLFSNKIFAQVSKRTSLNKAAADFQKIKSSNKPNQLYSFFLNLLALKFNLKSYEITHDQIIEVLKKSGLDEAKINEFVDYLNECASLHFITTQTGAESALNENIFKKGEYWIIILTK